MAFLVWWVNEDIVYIGDDKFAEYVPQYIIDQALEYAWHKTDSSAVQCGSYSLWQPCLKTTVNSEQM